MQPELRNLLDHFDEHCLVIRSFYVWATIFPEAKQSTSFGKGHAFTPKKKRAYLKKLAELLKQSVDFEKICGTVRLTILYSFPWRNEDKPLRSLGWIFMSERPDIDNLQKPLLDSLQKFCLADDAQVVEVKARKIRTSEPCIVVRIDEIRPAR